MGTKIEITEELVTKVKALLDQDLGTRTIARQLGISRWIVKQTYKVLGLYDI
jgi:DNA-binding transcriptional regulator LsrR (DeoR family)